MKKDTHCLSSMADGEAILHNGTSSNETPCPLAVLTHTKAESSNPKPPTSSGEGSAPSCCCNVLLAYEPYSRGPDHDPAEWFRRCPIHQKDNKSFWLFIETLEDFDDAMRSADLTPEGKAFRRELLAMKTNSEVKLQTPGGVK